MLHKDVRIIEKIVQRIEAILAYCKDLNYDEFINNSMLTEACVFNLLQIGEMCNRDLSVPFQKEFNSIPWHQIYGLRNRIVHGYDDIQMNIIWETISGDLPRLHSDLLKILKQIR